MKNQRRDSKLEAEVLSFINAKNQATLHFKREKALNQTREMIQAAPSLTRKSKEKLINCYWEEARAISNLMDYFTKLEEVKAEKANGEEL